MLMMVWSLPLSAAPVVREEGELFFKDLRDGKTDRVQLAVQIIPAVEVHKIPRYMDIYNVTQKPAGIRSFAVVRSSFYLPLSLSEIRARMSQPLSLSRYSKKMKIKSCEQATCSGEIKTTLASLDVSLKYGIIDKANAEGSWQEAFQALHQPDLISAQEFTHIESVFAHGGSFTAFYKMSEGLTWAQSYQVFSVKASSYEKARVIPFLNLEKIIRGTIRDMILDVRSSLLQEKLYAAAVSSATRMPASSNYDKDLYRQSEYQLVDPEGDQALIRRASVVPKHSLEALFSDEKFTRKGDVWMPEIWETLDPLAGRAPEPVSSPETSIQGRERPIKLAEFAEMMDQVLREEALRGMKPVVGAFHRWAPETKENIKSPVLIFSKIFVSLSMGFTYRFMTTGHERGLWQWMMTQDYNSITFPEMFRASLRLNQGDVYLALLTVENLLAANWRYPGRESLPATKRLRPITSGYNYSYDKFGTWYHFFGMILYGYTTGSSLRSSVVGRVEALGSNVLSRGVDKTQKQWFNKLGGHVGEALRDSVEKGTYLKSPWNSAALSEDYYLNREEDFRDRLPLQQSQVLNLHVVQASEGTSSRVLIRHHGVESFESCQVELMSDKGAGYYSPFKYTLLNVTLKNQTVNELTLPEPLPQGLRVFVTSCLKGADQALEYRAKSL